MEIKPYALIPVDAIRSNTVGLSCVTSLSGEWTYGPGASDADARAKAVGFLMWRGWTLTKTGIISVGLL